MSTSCYTRATMPMASRRALRLPIVHAASDRTRGLYMLPRRRRCGRLQLWLTDRPRAARAASDCRGPLGTPQAVPPPPLLSNLHLDHQPRARPPADAAAEDEPPIATMTIAIPSLLDRPRPPNGPAGLPSTSSSSSSNTLSTQICSIMKDLDQSDHKPLRLVVSGLSPSRAAAATKPL